MSYIQWNEQLAKVCKHTKITVLYKADLRIRFKDV